MATVHTFDQSLANGETAEQILDRHFHKRYTVEPAPMHHQRLGIDRFFTRRSDGKRYHVEYKADVMAQHTNRVFIEVLSNDTTGKLGWAYATTADILVLFVPHLEQAYIMDPRAVRETVREVWMRQFPLKVSANQGYNSVGCCVPLHVLAAHPAVKTHSVPLTEQQRAQLAWAS